MVGFIYGVCDDEVINRVFIKRKTPMPSLWFSVPRWWINVRKSSPQRHRVPLRKHRERQPLFPTEWFANFAENEHITFSSRTRPCFCTATGAGVGQTRSGFL